VWRRDALILLVSTIPLALSACGKTDVRLTAKGIPQLRPKWDPPTPAYGFVPVPAYGSSTNGECGHGYQSASRPDGGASE
jgi:hypothetical protein